MPQIIKQFILGTAIRITTILDIATATSAKITIEDSAGTEKVTRTDMTKEEDKVYSYIYQSDDDDNSGTYTVIIEITYGGYTSMSKGQFDLVSITSQWAIRH